MFKSKENYWPYSTALMLNMRGKPAEIARKKWKIMSKNKPYPSDIDDAVRAVNDYGLFREIKRVNIRKEGKYWNVIGVGF